MVVDLATWNLRPSCKCLESKDCEETLMKGGGGITMGMDNQNGMKHHNRYKVTP